MKRGTFKISTNLYRFRNNSTIIVKVYVRNDNKAILTKTLTIQQSITPEAEVKKSVIYNDPEASTINYYFNLFKAEIKRLVETSTPEQIADDIQAIATTPVFAGFFAFNKVKEKNVEKQPKQPKREKQPKQPKREKKPNKQVMKYGTFKTNTNLARFRSNTIVAIIYVRNNNKVIFRKAVTIQQTITPEAEVKKSVVYNDPEAETINYYFSLFKQEVKQLGETSTPETIADDIQRLVETPVFSKFFCDGKKHERISKPPKERVGKSVQWGGHYRKRDIDRDVRIIRSFDPYAFNDDFQNKGHVLHTKQFNRSGEPLCIKENYKQAVKNGSYSGTQEGYYGKIKPYLTDIESWQQIQDDEELKEKIEIYNNDRLIDFALDDEPTEEKEYAPYISRDQWEVMMDDYIKKLKIKWQQEEKQTAEK